MSRQEPQKVHVDFRPPDLLIEVRRSRPRHTGGNGKMKQIGGVSGGVVCSVGLGVPGARTMEKEAIWCDTCHVSQILRYQPVQCHV